MKEIDDEVWDVFKRSWTLLGVRTDEELVRALENELWVSSNIILNDAQAALVDDAPEAYAQREIGLEKKRLEKSKVYECSTFGE